MAKDESIDCILPSKVWEENVHVPGETWTILPIKTFIAHISATKQYLYFSLSGLFHIA